MKRSNSLIILLTLAVFAGVLAQVTWRLRGHLRTQMLEQKAGLLVVVAEREAGRNGRPLVDLVLDMVDMEGVVGIRLFDEDGASLGALPKSLSAGQLDPAEVNGAGPRCTWQPEVYLDTFYADPFGQLSTDPVPLLLVAFAIRAGTGEPPSGYAEFMLDGLPTQAAFHDLDRSLLQQSLMAFATGGALILGVLLVSFRRLERKNRDLARANQELTLHAKTAALGALSSHLFHGLKNVVAGLNLAVEHGSENRDDALLAARQLQGMVQEVVGMISDQESGLTYTLSTSEVLDLVRARGEKIAGPRGVQIVSRCTQPCTFSSVQANLVMLTLENLVRNAVEASPPGEVVTVQYFCDKGQHRFTVTDCGSGLPESRREGVFQAGRSTKEGGSGLGLSISHQLCRHLGGELNLVRSGETGTEFEVVVPRVD